MVELVDIYANPEEHSSSYDSTKYDYCLDKSKLYLSSNDKDRSSNILHVINTHVLPNTLQNRFAFLLKGRFTFQIG